MDSSTVAMLAALVALVALSAYFSATETAFTIPEPHPPENPGRRRRQARRPDPGPGRPISTGCSPPSSSATTSSTTWPPPSARCCLSSSSARGSGPTVSATVLTVVILIFGEVTPKSLAKERPEAWAIVCHAAAAGDGGAADAGELPVHPVEEAAAGCCCGTRTTTASPRRS